MLAKLLFLAIITVFNKFMGGAEFMGGQMISIRPRLTQYSITMTTYCLFRELICLVEFMKVIALW